MTIVRIAFPCVVGVLLFALTVIIYNPGPNAKDGLLVLPVIIWSWVVLWGLIETLAGVYRAGYSKGRRS